MNVLDVQQVGKAYRHYASEWQRVFNWFGGHIPPSSEQWVLQDVSFSVRQGEAVGIVGQNGAGKSTLLKLITGTQFPTTGNVWVNGRVSAILELGMGFSPELSGRDNVLHTAGLMGFSHEMVLAQMAEIEAFAEIGAYFNEPVRTYSSGMQMRVAFAVATAFRPDILIVDEALSVGDAYFQHKSFNRIREFQQQGTTLLLVTHDHNLVRSVCDRAVLLEKGRLLKQGEPNDVVDFYNAMIGEKEGQGTIRQEQTDMGKTRTVSGTGEARVVEITLTDSAGKPLEIVSVGAAVELRIVVQVHAPIPRLILGYMIRDRLGCPIFGINTDALQCPLDNVEVGELITYSFRFSANLGNGSYSISTALVSTDTHLVNNYEWRDLALVFEVANMNHAYFEGCNWMLPGLEIQRA
ncbi:ABC transporter ATP-binding protein [Thiothrix winogradskyi]|uniref:ABC transporter ATP-binding protein n=1 Tax=Thiothrix winogradskyi TaxID=96472 RepID=A0ABY3SXU6_9GAMM|nr:ABC transporter ATP-binding protein [Thiothrix winogradskyi]UJS24351.1 ABC transporter ATP-binding protein [Thiothrix winogradskyi]